MNFNAEHNKLLQKLNDISYRDLLKYKARIDAVESKLKALQSEARSINRGTQRLITSEALTEFQGQDGPLMFNSDVNNGVPTDATKRNLRVSPAKSYCCCERESLKKITSKRLNHSETIFAKEDVAWNNMIKT